MSKITINKVGKLLNRGKKPDEVAMILGLSRRRIYQIADRHNFPTNPSVAPGGPLEGKIFRAHAALTVEELSRVYRIALPLLDRILQRQCPHCLCAPA
jgi:hypothetical protein